ncbi:carboxyl transferase domain-containing protein [Corynebacterium kroppenstedtii]|uniref:carboxyl transferase domain-containing protein n=1 Tax=Corynebacterium sp. PCR 32 TaxID=3351342 RepID=UPI0030B3A189
MASDSDTSPTSPSGSSTTNPPAAFTPDTYPPHLSAYELIDDVLDPDSWTSWDTPPEYGDIPDHYIATLAHAREKSGVDEAVVTGEGTINGYRVAVIASEFSFLGGSLGAATSRRIINSIHRATAERLPLLISPASGGTRMQEGSSAFVLVISITAAINRHKDHHLPYLVYLRHPTTGGAMASWGAAGHLTFAQPGATVGFLGPRVVELTTGTPLTPGVQTSEHLSHHGVIDGVIHPAGLRDRVTKLFDVLIQPDQMREACEPASLSGTVMSAWDAVTRTRNPQRTGTADLVNVLSDQWIPLSGSGDGRTSDAVIVGVTRISGQSLVLVGMDRRAQKPLGGTPLGTEAMRCARRGVMLARELDIPLVSIIDTPGGEVSDHAEQTGMAWSIGRTLTEVVNLDVPTVSVIIGQGCGGAALSLVPADQVLACEDAWLAPLPPEGASAVIHRDVGHAAEMIESQSVTAGQLYDRGIIDRIIPALGTSDADADSTTVIEAIAHALWEVKITSTVRCGREQRRAHYERLAALL